MLALAALLACTSGDVLPVDTSDTGEAPWPSKEAVADWEELLALSEVALADHGVPGAAIAVVLDGRLAFSGGLGVEQEDLDPSEEGAVPDGDTLFWVASITKMVTAATVLSLADDGALDLDAPITEALPLRLEEPYDPDSVTLHHLLSHTGGIPDGIEYRCDETLTEHWTGEEGPLWSPPGRLWNYTNMGYSLAGAAVEHVDGQPFGEAARQRVFEPLGMDGATFDAMEAASRDYATGHSFNSWGNRVDVVPGSYDCAVSHPPGFLWASVHDYARFAEATLAGGGEGLSPAAVEAMTTRHADTGWTPDMGYGYGVFVDRYKELDTVWHDGGLDGFRTTWWVVPERDFAVVVFINTHTWSPANIAAAAVELFLEPTGEQVDYSTDPSTWDAFEGTYDDPHRLGRVEIAVEGQALAATFHRWGSTVDLVQYAGDTFYGPINGTPALVTFARDEHDVGEYLVTRLGVGVRVDGEEPPPAAPVPIVTSVLDGPVPWRYH